MRRPTMRASEVAELLPLKRAGDLKQIVGAVGSGVPDFLHRTDFVDRRLRQPGHR